MAEQVTERRQVHELPPLRLVITEHQVETIACLACGHRSVGTFPDGVDAPAQYGPWMQALVVYLSQFQLLPLARISELVADLWGGQLSDDRHLDCGSGQDAGTQPAQAQAMAGSEPAGSCG